MNDLVKMKYQHNVILYLPCTTSREATYIPLFVQIVEIMMKS